MRQLAVRKTMCLSECLSNEPLKSNHEYLCWDEDILGAKPELNYEYISNARSILNIIVIVISRQYLHFFTLWL